MEEEEDFLREEARQAKVMHAWHRTCPFDSSFNTDTTINPTSTLF